MSPRAVLIGPMGAGKTTTGWALARAWRVGFRDTDHDIESQAGKPIAEIFIDDGEAHFRQLERAAVAHALATHDGVLALGGGAVLAPETQALLKQQRVVFLDVSLAAAAKRVGLGAGRPLLMGNVRSKIKQILDERSPLYRSLATVTVLTDGLSPDQVARAIDTALQEEVKGP